MGVSLASQNRDEFQRLMREALDIDPELDRGNRLATILAQRKAQYLLDHIDELFANDAGPADAWFWSLRLDHAHLNGGGERP